MSVSVLIIDIGHTAKQEISSFKGRMRIFKETDTMAP
jgi:hypothetical protein